ncbi:head-tail connector protein [Heyndrickxia sp. FSL K6-6286]|uniref:head-tail connector protein n=1 Tax=Heyndrickxia sp. FSL K6-6286 TaxID=2921510 RepID=UPI00315B05F3
MILEDVKTALRISHDSLDDEILDLIEEARHDLMLSGVSSEKAKNDEDSLIKRAIKTYCKAEFSSDIKDAERFHLSYKLLKIHLALAGDYNA